MGHAPWATPHHMHTILLSTLTRHRKLATILGNLEADLQQGAYTNLKLVWVLWWSTVIGLVLQEMSARLGVRHQPSPSAFANTTAATAFTTITTIITATTNTNTTTNTTTTTTRWSRGRTWPLWHVKM